MAFWHKSLCLAVNLEPINSAICIHSLDFSSVGAVPLIELKHEDMLAHHF